MMADDRQWVERNGVLVPSASLDGVARIVERIEQRVERIERFLDSAENPYRPAPYSPYHGMRDLLNDFGRPHEHPYVRGTKVHESNDCPWPGKRPEFTKDAEEAERVNIGIHMPDAPPMPTIYGDLAERIDEQFPGVRSMQKSFYESKDEEDVP